LKSFLSLANDTIKNIKEIMLAFIYWFCLVVTLILLGLDWNNRRNKLQLIVTAVIALVPLVNILVAVVVIKDSMPLIKKWYNEFSNY